MSYWFIGSNIQIVLHYFSLSRHTILFNVIFNEQFPISFETMSLEFKGNKFTWVGRFES